MKKNNVFIEYDNVDFKSFWKHISYDQRLAIVEFLKVYLNDFIQDDGRVIIPFFRVNLEYDN